MADMPSYLTTEEVAQRLRVSTVTVQRLVARGQFPHAIRSSTGKNAGFRIPLEDLEEYIKKQNQGAISRS
jgi:excisionase family DNA binding protein